MGPVGIAGTASDAGGAVASVKVRIRRADGKTWNGSSFEAAENWLDVSTSDGFASWNYDWTPDGATITSGQLVSVTARATDIAGLQKQSVEHTSGAPAAAAVSIAGGATWASSPTVPVELSYANLTHTRWSTNAGATWTGWTPIAGTKTVKTLTLPAGDGAKTVTFQFARSASGPALKTAADSIKLDDTNPTVAATAPKAGFSFNTAKVAIAGTVADAATGSGVSTVSVRIRRSDGLSGTGPGGTQPNTGCRPAGRPARGATTGIPMRRHARAASPSPSCREHSTSRGTRRWAARSPRTTRSTR